MRYIESILKLLFLAGAIFFIVTKDISSSNFLCFLLVSLILGVVLMFNKDASYHFKQTKRDLGMRKIEGVLLVIFSVVISLLIMPRV